MNGQIDSLRRFLAAREALPFEAAGSALVVGAGKGGSGASTVAALLALVAADDGRSVLLVDGAETAGTLHLLLGVDAGPGVGALRGGETRPEELLVPVAAGLRLLTIGAGDPAPAAGGAEQRALARRACALYPRFDLVIVDAGSRLRDILDACAADGRSLLAVTATDRISVASTHALVKACGARHPGFPVDVLFNRCGEPEAAAAFEMLAGGTEHFLGRAVELAGALPDDARFRAAIEGGLAAPAAAVRSSLATAARKLAERVLAAIPQVER